MFGSTNVAGVFSPFQNGWLNVEFPANIVGAAVNVHKLINNGSTSISGGGLATTTGNTTTYIGLPAIGFAVTSYTTFVSREQAERQANVNALRSYLDLAADIGARYVRAFVGELTPGIPRDPGEDDAGPDEVE